MIEKLMISCITILLSIIIFTAQGTQTVIQEFNQITHFLGLYAISLLKSGLGIATIFGALGFFITTSPRVAHWPAYWKRIFFSIFIFCNIINQLLFNVINLPNNKNLVCLLGSCVSKIMPDNKKQLLF